ncbi:MAG: RDD family protein [Candidatus Omnitrophica bacterium]|nr:RDD family protein [Candidatus Omnitrophota bacterium]
MSDQIQGNVNVSGGLPVVKEATLGARFLAALFDLVIIPIILGIMFGLLFFAAAPALRNIVLIFVNIAWTCLRDIAGGAGPGKRMAGLKVVTTDGGQPSVGQYILRNILLWVPFVLLIGFIIETVMIFIVKKDRLGDRWAKCKVVSVK